MNFTSPTPIQKQALPILLGKPVDFIGLAATGTGKTAAFGIPLIEQIDTSSKSTKALVMCPTRELAIQVSGQLALLGKDKGLQVVTIYGGASYRPQIDGIKKGAHIIVGTPGRLIDMLDQKYVKLDQVKTLVLDEADEMLSLGFKDDLEKILQATNNPEIDCKTWLFSATMNAGVRQIASKHLKNPAQIQVKKDGTEHGTITQLYYAVQSRDKLEVLARILATNKNFYGIIFCQTKQEVANVANLLQKRALLVDCLHGDRSQNEREMILTKFRKRQISVIVATDVAARGLDVKDLTHVINFNLPREMDTYTHRIGRTGRNGQSGIALSLVGPDQIRVLKRIMQVTKAKIEKSSIPSVRDIARMEVMASLDQLSRMTPDSQRYRMAEKIISEIQDHEMLNGEMTLKELLARVIALKHSEFMMDDGRDLDFVGEGRTPRELDSQNGSQVRESRFGGGAPRSRDNYRGGGRSEGGYRRSDSGGGYDRGGGERNSGSSWDRPARSFDRPERSYDKPERSFDRPARSFDKPERSYDRPERSFDDRPARSFDKPERSYDRPERSFDRPARSFDKPERSYDRPERSTSFKKEFKPREEFAPRSEYKPREEFKPREDYKAKDGFVKKDSYKDKYKSRDSETASAEKPKRRIYAKTEKSADREKSSDKSGKETGKESFFSKKFGKKKTTSATSED
jgi:ATP-dependent RNA helicase DeaD